MPCCPAACNQRPCVVIRAKADCTHTVGAAVPCMLSLCSQYNVNVQQRRDVPDTASESTVRANPAHCCSWWLAGGTLVRPPEVAASRPGPMPERCPACPSSEDTAAARHPRCRRSSLPPGKLRVGALLDRLQGWICHGARLLRCMILSVALFTLDATIVEASLKRLRTLGSHGSTRAGASVWPVVKSNSILCGSCLRPGTVASGSELLSSPL